MSKAPIVPKILNKHLEAATETPSPRRRSSRLSGVKAASPVDLDEILPSRRRTRRASNSSVTSSLANDEKNDEPLEIGETIPEEENGPEEMAENPGPANDEIVGQYVENVRPQSPGKNVNECTKGPNTSISPAKIGDSIAVVEAGEKGELESGEKSTENCEMPQDDVHMADNEDEKRSGLKPEIQNVEAESDPSKSPDKSGEKTDGIIDVVTVEPVTEEKAETEEIGKEKSENEDAITDVADLDKENFVAKMESEGAKPENNLPAKAKKDASASDMQKNLQTSVQVMRGRCKSGRFWKSERERFRSVIKSKGMKQNFNQTLKRREEMKRVKEYEKSLRDEMKRKKEDLRARQEENKKKREENQKKNEVYQQIKDPAKLKRMKRKQLRQLAKRDTTVVQR